MPYRRSYKRKGKKAPRKQYKRKGKYVRYRKGNTSTMATYPYPPKMRTALVINTSSSLYDAVNQNVAKVYRPTSYFDIDPSLGGPSYGGYTTLASMYARYRVIAFKYTLTLVNKGTDPILVSTQAIASTAQPDESGAVNYVEHAIENPYGRYTTLGQNTGAGNVRVLKGYVNAKALWATPEVKTDSSWASLTGNSPSANVWLRIAAKSLTGTSLTNGFVYNLRIKAYGYWDQRIDVTN